MRTLLCALLVAAPAVAQHPPVPAPQPVLRQAVQAKPVPVPQLMPAAPTPVVQARAVLVEKAAQEVRVEFRVVSVCGKESRAAVAKLIDTKGKDAKTVCLTQKQLYAVLEKCAADPATTVMQAPRIVAAAGEPATVKVADTMFFTTAVSVKVVGGKAVMVPTNEAVETGTTFNATATPSADGQFMKLKVAFCDRQMKADVPQLPVTTLITPEFEGGSEGKPIPFTQFVQVPVIDEVKCDHTVTLPDGGTVVIPVGTRTVVTKIESKVPVLGDVPYLNRLFRNTAAREEECDVVLFATATRVKGTPVVVPAAAVSPQPDDVAKLVAAHHKACAAGKTDEAMRLAVQALAKDPTCFGK